MNSIFFDLETTDKNPIGQILNYSFILVDDQFEPVDELSGLIQISRLQIPSPQAILANRVDVFEHQRLAQDTEKTAMAKIFQFFSRALETTAPGQKLPVIGYNSCRFDIPYLRTSFIRNGINPYFNGRIVLRDLLFAGRKLASLRDDFPRSASRNAAKDQDRVSLTLENLGHEFGLLSGTQSHESRADVLLTIALAKVYRERYHLDVRDFDAFEALRDQSKPVRGMTRWMITPNYALAEKERFLRNPMVLLDFDYRSSLWIDLKRFAEKSDRSAISWFNHSGAQQFVVGEQEPLSPAEQKSVEAALLAFKDITLKNFFEVSSCDIEQDIYRLDFDAIGALEAAIWRGDGEAIKKVSNRDARVVLMRHQLAAYPLTSDLTDVLGKRLAQYAEYRYGGKAQLVKSINEGISEEKLKEAYHPTLDATLVEIGELKRTESNSESLKLLESLEQFIRQSAVFQVLQGNKQTAR